MNSIGAYNSNSKGFGFVRRIVAQFVNKRDQHRERPCRSAKVYLTNGASEGVKTALSLLIRNSNDGILVPIPQYPLYSALITTNSGKMLPYYMDEEKNWGLDMPDIIN